MMFRTTVVILALVACLVAMVGLERASQEATKPVWVERDFNTVAELTTFLNALPSDKAREAKVLAAPSNRNPLGWAGNPYVIWYTK